VREVRNRNRRGKRALDKQSAVKCRHLSDLHRAANQRYEAKLALDPQRHEAVREVRNRTRRAKRALDRQRHEAIRETDRQRKPRARQNHEQIKVLSDRDAASKRGNRVAQRPTTQQAATPAVQDAEAALNALQVGVIHWQNKRQRTKQASQPRALVIDHAGPSTQEAAPTVQLHPVLHLPEHAGLSAVDPTESDVAGGHRFAHSQQHKMMVTLTESDIDRGRLWLVNDLPVIQDATHGQPEATVHIESDKLEGRGRLWLVNDPPLNPMASPK